MFCISFCLNICAPSYAYATSYIAGIGISYVANAKVVFGNDSLDISTFALYTVVYLLLFLTSLKLYDFLISHHLASLWLAPLVVIVIVFPLGYVLNSKLLGKRPSK